MNSEDGESVLSDVSINTNMRVFNGGINEKGINLKKIEKKDYILKEIKKIENGNEILEPISFRPSNSDIINNFSIDMERLNLQNEYEMEENIFKNLREKLDEGDPIRGNKYKPTNSSTINCTISSIEKGIAILVTSDDTIFCLPEFFLPKNSIPGNSYQILINETLKMQNKVTNIYNLQKDFKRKKKKNNLINI